MNNVIDMSRVVTWQYDKAYSLLKLLRAKEDLANYACGDIFDYVLEHMYRFLEKDDPDEKDKFGIYIFGRVLGIPWPTTNGKAIDAKLYLRILKARFFLLLNDATPETYSKFFYYLFDCEHNIGKKVIFSDNLDMTFTLKFNWSLSDDDQVIVDLGENEGLYDHPSGVEFSKFMGSDFKFGALAFNMADSTVNPNPNPPDYKEIGPTGDKMNVYRGNFSNSKFAPEWRVMFIDWDGSLLLKTNVLDGTKWSDIEKPRPVREGYVLKGWKNAPSSTLNANVTVKAMYEEATYCEILRLGRN